MSADSFAARHKLLPNALRNAWPTISAALSRKDEEIERLREAQDRFKVVSGYETFETATMDIAALRTQLACSAASGHELRESNLAHAMLLHRLRGTITPGFGTRYHQAVPL